MRHYKHLTLYERENLLFLRAKGYSITAIAESMGRNKGTISREFRRNSVANQYMPVVAQHQYQARRAYCKPHNRLEHARLLEHVKHRLLECQWSPEEIAGRLRAEYGRCVIRHHNHLSCDIQWMVERSQSLHGKRHKKVEAPWQAQEEALH